MAERYDFYVHDNRKITFNLTEPIMREDSGVTDFVFHIPKVLNELEVSDWAWWLVFVNAKKEKYSIALTLSDDPESPLEKNVATYTVDYAMSIKAGAVQFALEAINTGTGGAIDNEWHTLTYETKVKETLQGNQAEYAETESDIISALLEEVRTKMNQVIGGATPTPVKYKAQMTDPNAVYLYIGSEPNEHAGHWYYHNGTTFVSGGVYGAGVVDSVPTQGSSNAVSSGGVYEALHDTDTTLSQSGQAADAKVVGELKSALSDLYTLDNFTKPSGGMQVFPYEITAGTTYWFTNLTNNNTVNVRTCTSDGTEIENVKNGFSYNETVEFLATQNASYIRIYSGVNDTTISVGTFGSRLIEINDKVDSTNEALTKANDEVLDLVGYEWDEGHFIGNAGTPGDATDRACTDFIPCSPLVSITYVGENNNANVCGIAFYDKYYQYISGDINSGTLGEPVTLTTPPKTAYLRMSTKLSILSESYFKYNGLKNSALMAVSQRAANATFYVDGLNGSDTTGNGMPTNPFKTIQHALDLGATKIGILPIPTYQETINVNGGDLHLFAYRTIWSDSAPNRIRAKFDGNNSVSTILTIENANKVILEDLEIYNCTGDGCLLNMCNNVEMINCTFHDNGNNGVVINYTNGVFHDCKAYDNGHDGFNLNYYGDTQFFNCSGFNNGDDGISHHQGTTGLIDGGEWYGNVKGGIASPCYGARVNIQNVYSHDNGYGIYAFASGQSDARAFSVWNCVLVNNSNYGIAVRYNTPYIYKNKIADNTVGQTTAYGTAVFHTLD